MDIEFCQMFLMSLLRLSADEWKKKICYIYTMEFTQPQKKNEILSFIAKWMGQKNIMLNEIS